MGKYNVLFKCGHEEEVEIFGKYKDREAKIEYYKENCVCSKCYKKQQTEKTEAAGVKVPEIIKNKKWNFKFYGDAIYADNEKINITDEQEAELVEYKNNYIKMQLKIDELENDILNKRMRLKEFNRILDAHSELRRLDSMSKLYKKGENKVYEAASNKSLFSSLRIVIDVDREEEFEDDKKKIYYTARKINLCEEEFEL